MAARQAVQDLLALLERMGIARASTFFHTEVFTCEAYEEALAALTPRPDCIIVKNLFLKDQKSGQLWLCCLPDDGKVDLKHISSQLGCKSMRFAGGDVLMSTLGVEKGCVTPLAVVNDTQSQVRVALARSLMSTPKLLAVHPLVNSATTLLSPQQLQDFLQLSLK